LLSCALVEPLVQLPYSERLARLQVRGLGLWDVLAACERQGSLDAAIRRGRLNDLTGLRVGAPHLRTVLFNGTRAGRHAAALAAAGYAVAVLPSSSAAHAGCGFDAKLSLWRAALRTALVC
jgi:hypoxanthine-DNA glycosylase